MDIPCISNLATGIADTGTKREVDLGDGRRVAAADQSAEQSAAPSWPEHQHHDLSSRLPDARLQSDCRSDLPSDPR